MSANLTAEQLAKLLADAKAVLNQWDNGPRPAIAYAVEPYDIRLARACINLAEETVRLRELLKRAKRVVWDESTLFRDIESALKEPSP